MSTSPAKPTSADSPGSATAPGRLFSGPARLVFLVAFVLAAAFALYTNHVWEDYYITYRASKNLATGHGLVFNPGDRLHTFTSPLGVLLPALSSLLTLNRSDDAALWIFRALSITAFAGAVAVFFTALLRAHGRLWLALLAAAWLATDAKSLDFTINGMETALLLLCLAGILLIQFSAPPATRSSRRWLWLGLAWGATMWTRPDGFLYIGLLAAAGWLFGPAARGDVSRLAWIKTCLLAGLVCTAVYLPWFLWAWWYYGSPVPHTIVAKGNLATSTKTLLGALKTFVTLPVKVWQGDGTATSLPGAFLPSYFIMGGWPAWLAPVAAALASVAAFSWLLPPLDPRARVASFVFCGFQVYLSYYPYFPFPWYQPGTTLLALFALAGLAAWLFSAFATRRSLQPLTRTAGVVLVAAPLALNLFVTPAVAHQVAAQQRWIEDGNRRKIGEWLHGHAAPGETVFMEPLGYIGYFSQLKTYDFPGLSSREVSAAVREIGPDWSELIHFLAPDWLVLRPGDIRQIEASHRSLLLSYYEPVQEFDVRDRVAALDLRGRPYLEVDARFVVYRRIPQPIRRQNEFGAAQSRYDIGFRDFSGHHLLMVHAPGQLTIPIPPGSRHARIDYGFPPDSFSGEQRTDGAIFRIVWRSGTERHLLFRRRLTPDSNEEDRLILPANLDLPAATAPAELIVEADPDNSSVKDWTCFGLAQFAP